MTGYEMKKIRVNVKDSDSVIKQMKEKGCTLLSSFITIEHTTKEVFLYVNNMGIITYGTSESYFLEHEYKELFINVPEETFFIKDEDLFQSKEEILSIDWEQRRYEISKGILSNQIIACIMENNGYNANALVNTAIELADELIKQLKEK